MGRDDRHNLFDRDDSLPDCVGQKKTAEKQGDFGKEI